MRINDSFFGVLLLLAAVALVMEASTFPGLPGQNYGPAFFPVIIGLVLGGCGLVLLVQGLPALRRGERIALGPWVRSPLHWFRLVLALGSILAFVLGLELIGFIPLAFTCLLVLQVVFGQPRWRSVLVAALATLGTHTAFYKVLLVPLPWGLLDPIAW